MTTYAGKIAVHETLGASTVDTVELAGCRPSLTVVNRTGTAEIYFTVATGAKAPTPPTVSGNDCFVLPAAICSLSLPWLEGQFIVSLISAGAEAYSVENL